jgi:histidyl-tRNA synthetase
MEMAGRSLKSQMKRADRSGAPWVLIYGDHEAEKGVAVLRNMATKEQTELPVAGLIDQIRQITARTATEK